MKYYDLNEDLEKFPDAWCYLVYSERSVGKTYSTLKLCVEDKKPFLFMKRTIEDINMLCAKAKKGVKFDISPFKPLNRDLGWNVKPLKVEKGIAGFYNYNEEDEPAGFPLGYAGALTAAKDIKGFDMSEVDIMIFDEFIPKKYERINRNEGDALLDIYMTLRRDRIERGREDLKLVCLANATQINNPTMQVLDVIDDVAKLEITGDEYLYIEDRGILIHKIPCKEKAESEKKGIEKAMQGTVWGDMSFGGNFSYDDFSAVRHQRMKGYRPIVSYIYRKKQVYIYQKDNFFYATNAKSDKVPVFNLSRENEQKRFFNEYVIDLRCACIEDRMQFTDFTMYDLIVNYKKIFRL